MEEREKKQSVWVCLYACAGVRVTGVSQKESGRKPGGSDTDREKMFNLARFPQRHLISFNPCGR